MHAGRFVLAQLLDFLARWQLRQCIQRHGGERRVRHFSCTDQFLVMLFAQLTYRESLRDIEVNLRAHAPQLYHLGLRGHVARATLADANATRPWQIWADLAAVLSHEARALYAQEKLGIRFRHTVYAFDATVIDLCLTLFPWCQFRRRKSAVKLCTLLDIRGQIPCFMRVSSGAVHEVSALDDLPLEAGSYYLLDRGFLDFVRLHRFVTHGAFFVIRAKDNLCYRVLERRVVDKATGLRRDQTIRLTGPLTKRKYPAPLRRVRYVVPETGRALVFLTNNFVLPASTICALYRQRWQVELFFKWIKQYLRIKSFFGTSENAVKTQVWIALCAYLLVAIVRKRLGVQMSMGDMLQVLSLSLFEKTPLLQVFSRHATSPAHAPEHNLFNNNDF